MWRNAAPRIVPAPSAIQRCAVMCVQRKKNGTEPAMKPITTIERLRRMSELDCIVEGARDYRT